MTQVVGGEAGDLGVRRQGLDGDPLVPLDLADGGPRHVHQRNRAGVPLVVLVPRQDQHVLAVAPHDRGHVVQLEQGGEPLRVLLALLQSLDHGELPLDEAQGAQRQVDEGVVDGVLQPLQLLGQLGDLGLERGPLGREGLPAGEQLPVLGLQGLQPARGALTHAVELAVEGVDRPHDLGELVVAPGVADRFGGLGVGGDPAGTEPEDGERLGEGAGDRRRDADRDQQTASEQGEPDLQRGDVVVPQLLQACDLSGPQGGLGAAHPVDPGGERGLDLLGVGAAVRVGQLGAVGQPGEVLLRGVDLGAGHRGGEPVAGGGPGRLVERGERGELPHAGLLGGGAQVVPGPGVLAAAVVLALDRKAGVRIERGAGRLRTRHGERGQQQAARGGRLLHRAAEGERGTGGVGGARRGLLGELTGDAVELGDHLGVRLVGLQRRALARECLTAQGGDGGEVAAQRRGGVGGDLVHLTVDPCGGVGRVALAVLVTARRDVRDHLVALVREGVREGDRLLVQLGERDQPLGLVEVGGGAQSHRGARGDHGDPDDGHAGDQPAAHPYGPLARAHGRRRRPGYVARAVLAPRPLLLHRCSQS